MNATTTTIHNPQHAQDTIVSTMVSRILPVLAEPDFTLDAVVPCRNEALTLDANIRTLANYLETYMPGRYTITVADSASTDNTPMVVTSLQMHLPHIRMIREEEKGRGRALKTAWATSISDIVMYMDEDLSTDLNHIPELLAPLVAGTAGLATGSRRLKGSAVERGFKREFISRTYIAILKRSLRFKASDAQCGFKAIRHDVAQEIVPTVKDDAWFFDTELLVKAERAGYPVHEVAIKWIDDPNSSVHLIQTAREDISGVLRLRSEFGRWLTVKKAIIGIILLLIALLYLTTLL